MTTETKSYIQELVDSREKRARKTAAMDTVAHAACEQLANTPLGELIELYKPTLDLGTSFFYDKPTIDVGFSAITHPEIRTALDKCGMLPIGPWHKHQSWVHYGDGQPRRSYKKVLEWHGCELTVSITESGLFHGCRVVEVQDPPDKRVVCDRRPS